MASHAQKHFIRQLNLQNRKRRSSLFDMQPDQDSVRLCSSLVSCTVVSCTNHTRQPIPRLSPAMRDCRTQQTAQGSHPRRPGARRAIVWESQQAREPAALNSMPQVRTVSEHTQSLCCEKAKLEALQTLPVSYVQKLMTEQSYGCNAMRQRSMSWAHAKDECLGCDSQDC